MGCWGCRRMKMVPQCGVTQLSACFTRQRPWSLAYSSLTGDLWIWRAGPPLNGSGMSLRGDGAGQIGLSFLHLRVETECRCTGNKPGTWLRLPLPPLPQFMPKGIGNLTLLPTHLFAPYSPFSNLARPSSNLPGPHTAQRWGGGPP